jgi:adenine-specific DNA-methyltransferase
MKATIQPVLDEGGHYPHHNLYWLTSEKWDLRVLGGLLLSRVAEMFVAAYGVKMRGGTLRFQAQYLRLIRVPDPDTIAPEVKARLVQAFEMRDAEAATGAALEAYGLASLPD